VTPGIFDAGTTARHNDDMRLRIRLVKDDGRWGAVISGLPDHSKVFAGGATREEALRNAKVAALEALVECMHGACRDVRFSSVSFGVEGGRKKRSAGRRAVVRRSMSDLQVLGL
jgi:predicted RNase H-like HicB family nuclease